MKLTPQQYANVKEFNLKQLAALFDYTVVRIWQLVNAGKVKFSAGAIEKDPTRTRGNRRGIRVPKSQIAVLKTLLKTEKLHFAPTKKAKTPRAAKVTQAVEPLQVTEAPEAPVVEGSVL